VVAEGHLGPLSKAEFCQLSADIFKFYMWDQKQGTYGQKTKKWLKVRTLLTGGNSGKSKWDER